MEDCSRRRNTDHENSKRDSESAAVDSRKVEEAAWDPPTEFNKLKSAVFADIIYLPYPGMSYSPVRTYTVMLKALNLIKSIRSIDLP
jgi:hypothetical protein